MWQRLAPLLRKAGHEAYAPSLTGIGERAHLASPAISLSTHIADVQAVLRYERLDDVVLVGHSYAGMVVTGVADREPQAIQTLVYLDAFVPRTGQALVDLLPARVREHLPREGWQVPPLPPAAQGMSDAAEIAWLEGRRDAHPMKCFTEKLELAGAFRGQRAYVACTGYSPTSFAGFAEQARNDPAWRYHELATHHYPHVSMPAQTAGVLLNYA